MNDAAGGGRSQSVIDVLVAEDNEVNQLVFQYTLAEMNLRWTIVGDGAAAVERALQDRPTVILMDVSMPVMSGDEAIRRLRAKEKEAGYRPVIIAVTAHALRGDRERLIEAGADDYLAKPVSPDALTKMIRSWLDRSG